MSYEVRRPDHGDRSSLDELLIEDYQRSGVAKLPLTDAQIEDYSERAWVAFDGQNNPRAITLADAWKYGDAAPYSRLPTKILAAFSKAGGLYRGETGVFVLSAVDYQEGGASTALVDKTKVLEPKTKTKTKTKTGAVHVPIIETGEAGRALRAFLEGRGFRAGREGLVYPSGVKEPVPTILMTRKK